MIDNLVKTAQSSKEYIGSQEDIANAVNGYLATVPQFAGYYGELSNAINDVSDSLNQSTEDVIASKKSLEDVLKGYPELIKMATVGELDEDVLTSTEKYADLLAELGINADSSSNDLKKVVEEIQNIADNNWIDNMKNVTDEFEALGNAYDKIFNEKKSLGM